MPESGGNHVSGFFAKFENDLYFGAYSLLEVMLLKMKVGTTNEANIVNIFNHVQLKTSCLEKFCFYFESYLNFQVSGKLLR